MARANSYRRYAAECLALAQRAKTPQDRVRLLEMAYDWSKLALKAEEYPEEPSDLALPNQFAINPTDKSGGT